MDMFTVVDLELPSCGQVANTKCGSTGGGTGTGTGYNTSAWRYG